MAWACWPSDAAGVPQRYWPTDPTGPSGVHGGYVEDDPCCWLHVPILPTDARWGCSQGIVQAGLFQWCHLGSENCLQSAAWQIIPRCPARCPDTPCHRHSYPGAQGVIWHPCGMPPDMDRNPPTWTQAAWQSCWKPSPGSRWTLMWPLTVWRGLL